MDAPGRDWIRGLYTVPKNDPHISEYIEHHFFRITDNGAALVAQQLRAGGPVDWFSMDRSSWSRFIISLILRNPEYVARMAAEVVSFYDPVSGEYNNAKYQEIRKRDDPETFEDYLAKSVYHPAGRMSA